MPRKTARAAKTAKKTGRKVVAKKARKKKTTARKVTQKKGTAKKSTKKKKPAAKRAPKKTTAEPSADERQETSSKPFEIEYVSTSQKKPPRKFEIQYASPPDEDSQEPLPQQSKRVAPPLLTPKTQIPFTVLGKNDADRQSEEAPPQIRPGRRRRKDSDE